MYFSASVHQKTKVMTGLVKNDPYCTLLKKQAFCLTANQISNKETPLVHCANPFDLRVFSVTHFPKIMKRLNA